VAAQRVDRHADQRAATADSLEERLVARPDPFEAFVDVAHPFLRAEIAEHGDGPGCIGKRMRLGIGPRGVGLEQRHARAEPGGGDSVGIEAGHGAGPHAAAGVAPQRPGHSLEFRVAGEPAQVGKGPLEGVGGAISRVAPELAVGCLGLLVHRRQERTVVFGGEGLPVEIVSAGEA